MNRLKKHFLGMIAIVGLLAAQSFAGQLETGQPSRPRHTETSLARDVALPTARGQEAVRALKQRQLYDSLAAAYRAARFRVEPNEHPGLPGQSAYHASNPANEMDAEFAADAIHITAIESGGGARAVALRLTGFGHGANLQSP